MTPYVAIVLAAALEGFGKEFGSQIASRLFGSNDRSARRIKAALHQISQQLRQITVQLAYLTSLVEHLPEVIVGQYRRELIDEAYRLLLAMQEELETTPDDAQLEPPSREFAIQLLAAWHTTVDLEDRPEELMMLPHRSELVRFVMVNDVSGIIRNGVAAKREMLQASIDQSTKSAGEAYDEADAILGRDYFTSGSTSAEDPFIVWAKAPQKMLRIRGPRLGNRGPRLTIKVPDTKWGEAQTNAVRRLEALRLVIRKELSEVRAAIPPLELLKLYEDTLPEAIDAEAEALLDAEPVGMINFTA